MSKGLKNFMVICAIVLAVGVLLSLIGFALGGFQHLDPNKNIHLTWYSDSVGDMANVEENLEEFDSAEINSDLVDVNFIPQEGDEYRVEIKYFEGMGEPKVEVKDGTLFIKKVSDGKMINLDLSGLISSRNGDSYINVYYPESKKFESIIVDNDMGNVNLHDLNCNELTAKMAAGDLDLTNVKVNRIQADVDMGQIDGKNMVINQESDISSAAGDVTISGEIKGENSIETDMGEIFLTTSLTEADYNYDVETDMGDVYLGSKTVSHNFEEQNAGATNVLDLNCGAGDIHIDFN